MVYNSMYEEYKAHPTVPMAYNLLQLAFTLNSRAINYPEPFEQMTKDRLVYNDPNLLIVACQAIDMVNLTKYKAIRKDLESRLKALPSSYKNLMIKSTSSIRFTDLNTIIPERNVTLFVEGETDAPLVERGQYFIYKDGDGIAKKEE